MPYCGDKAEFKYEVSSELVDELGVIIIERKGKDTLTVSNSVELKENMAIFKWPDQEKEDGTYYGGRKVDWKGLDKFKYKTKFKYQEFEVAIQVGDDSKLSGKRIKINAYPNKSATRRKVGFPLDITQPPPGPPQYNPTTGERILNEFPDTHESRKDWIQTNAGNFWIEFKEGEIIITIKVKLQHSDPNKSIPEEVWNHFKERAEKFWNDRGNGLRQWVFHGEKCIRKDDCNCRVVYQGEGGKKEKLLQGGCCKFPIKVNIEKGDDNPVIVQFLSPVDILFIYMLNPIRKELGQPLEYGPWDVHTQQIIYPEDVPNTYAHEVGHMMGLPDEYDGGTCAKDQSKFPITSDSIMGANQNKVFERHLSFPELFINWINSNVTPVKVLERK